MPFRRPLALCLIAFLSLLSACQSDQRGQDALALMGHIMAEEYDKAYTYIYHDESGTYTDAVFAQQAAFFRDIVRNNFGEAPAFSVSEVKETEAIQPDAPKGAEVYLQVENDSIYGFVALQVEPYSGLFRAFLLQEVMYPKDGR